MLPDPSDPEYDGSVGTPSNWRCGSGGGSGGGYFDPVVGGGSGGGGGHFRTVTTKTALYYVGETVDSAVIVSLESSGVEVPLLGRVGWPEVYEVGGGDWRRRVENASHNCTVHLAYASCDVFLLVVRTCEIYQFCFCNQGLFFVRRDHYKAHMDWEKFKGLCKRAGSCSGDELSVPLSSVVVTYAQNGRGADRKFHFKCYSSAFCNYVVPPRRLSGEDIMSFVNEVHKRARGAARECSVVLEDVRGTTVVLYPLGTRREHVVGGVGGN